MDLAPLHRLLGDMEKLVQTEMKQLLLSVAEQGLSARKAETRGAATG